MYAPPDFEFAVQRPPRPPMQPERVIGLIAFLIILFMCLIMSLNADAELFNPYNTARAQTQTQRGDLTASPQAPFASPTTAPRPTSTPLRLDQSARRDPALLIWPPAGGN
jgi:hypothetical protein